MAKHEIIYIYIFIFITDDLDSHIHALLPLHNPSKNKGSDASWQNDEEPPEEVHAPIRQSS